MTNQRRPSTHSLILGVVLVLVAAALLVPYQRGMFDHWLPAALAAAPHAASAPHPSGPIEVFFTTPALVSPDTRSVRRASPLLHAVLADVHTARRSIAVASFDYDLAALSDALLQARARGVQVRLIVDSLNLEDPQASEETGRLQDAGIGLVFQRDEPFMHNKFIVIDDRVVWTGSWNMTENDTYRNNNNFQRIASAALAAQFTGEFEQMFKGVFGTNKAQRTELAPVRVGAATISVYFSPEDGVEAYVLQRLKAARRSIRVMAFSFTSDAVTDALLQQRAAGVLVQGVFESQNTSGTGADFGKLQRGRAAVMKDGNCYIMHHKVIIIDDRIVITGSYNFTSSAERSNDENLLVINDPALARQYDAEFERIMQQAQLPARCQ